MVAVPSGRARSQFCSRLSVESVLHLIPKVCKVPAVKTCGLKPVGTAPAAERVGQVIVKQSPQVSPPPRSPVAAILASKRRADFDSGLELTKATFTPTSTGRDEHPRRNIIGPHH
jgi:hypothetical protein